jgi:hypothetical protein
MVSNQPPSSGQGRMYFTRARSAYSIACNSAAAKQMLLQPEIAFSYAYKNQVEMLADLSEEQVRNLIIHHNIPVTSESHLQALSSMFQIAHHCQSRNLLKSLAALNLSVKCDHYWYPATALTEHINATIKAKKENTMLAYKLKRIQKTTRAMVTNTLRFEDIIQSATDLSTNEVFETDDDEDEPKTATLL